MSSRVRCICGARGHLVVVGGSVGSVVAEPVEDGGQRAGLGSVCLRCGRGGRVPHSRRSRLTQSMSGADWRCQDQPGRAERSEPRSGGLDCRQAVELAVRIPISTRRRKRSRPERRALRSAHVPRRRSGTRSASDCAGHRHAVRRSGLPTGPLRSRGYGWQLRTGVGRAHRPGSAWSRLPDQCGDRSVARRDCAQAGRSGRTALALYGAATGGTTGSSVRPFAVVLAESRESARACTRGIRGRRGRAC